MLCSLSLWEKEHLEHKALLELSSQSLPLSLFQIPDDGLAVKMINSSSFALCSPLVFCVDLCYSSEPLLESLHQCFVPDMVSVVNYSVGLSHSLALWIYLCISWQ